MEIKVRVKQIDRKISTVKTYIYKTTESYKLKIAKCIFGQKTIFEAITT